MRSMAGVLEGVSVTGIVKPKGREAGDDFVCVCVCVYTHMDRLLCPWDSPSKNTGVRSHSVL